MKYTSTIFTLNKYLIDLAKKENESYSRLKALKILLLAKIKHFADTQDVLYNNMKFYSCDHFIEHEEIYEKYKFFAAYDIEYNENDEFEPDEKINVFIRDNECFLKRLIKMTPWDLTKYYHRVVFENTELFKNKFLDLSDIQVMSINMRNIKG